MKEYYVKYWGSSGRFLEEETRYCNLSNFIRKSNVDFPKLDCGDTISVEDFKITKVREVWCE